MFRVTGLDAAQFSHLYGLDDGQLASHGVTRLLTPDGGMPCRVSFTDSDPGERGLLLNYEHQPAANAFRSNHALFIREGAQGRIELIDELPEQLTSRLLSLRAFDAADTIVDADVVEGREAIPVIDQLLARPDTAYIHAHFARRGCYAARIDRA